MQEILAFILYFISFVPSLTQNPSHAARARRRHTGRMNILIAGLKRLLANIIRIGIVSDVDLANGLCRVKWAT